MVTNSVNDRRVHDNSAVADLGVAAYLGVSVRSSDGHILGSLCVIDNEPHDWTDIERRAMHDLSKMVETDLALRTVLRDNEMLLAEFDHRIRNLFTVFVGMVRMTAHNSEDVSSISEALTARLMAIDGAQRLVTPSVSGPKVTNELAHLDKRAALVLEPYKASSIRIGTETTAIRPQAATASALIFHELATNAIKYGALSDVDGALSVDWQMDGDTLVVTWRETHNEMDESNFDADRTGFGTTMLKVNIEQKQDGTQERVFPDKQMSLILRISVSALES
jgi:two-component sensor histidine kinase